MAQIRNVKLELLRPGPANNQLLSPLTPYLALCGADGPVTVHIPFEHRHLLNRLERLRYVTGGVPVSPEQQATEVREMGEALGKVLAQVPALFSEIGTAASNEDELVHLRLVTTAYELAMIPFELSIGADGFPGSGAPLFLQPTVPLSLTREVRRGRPLPVYWDRSPRILFAFASPDGLPAVPAQDHLDALRRAVEPWVKWRANQTDRLPEVKKLLTVLPNASLRTIRRACAESEYTHVHILAHGEPIEQEGDRHYGVALCVDGDPTGKQVVSGDVLATALTAKDAIGTTRFRPTLVSLSTCDSGQTGSVITPGGSIAHALHAAEIPWVIASQFPLWMRASSIATEVLFAGLLRGDDPRWVLRALRQRLRTDSPGTHDWGSIVAYAVVPWDFDRQVEAFRNRQTRQRIEVKFDQAEEMVKAAASRDGAAVAPDALNAVYESIRGELERWRDALPLTAPKSERAERLGMSAASEKRIGNLFPGESDRARKAYESAREFYRRALDAEPFNHWVITQYLSMTAVLAADLDVSGLASKYGAWWTAARQLSEWDLRNATGEKRAWALATLAELELLGSVYAGVVFDAESATREIQNFCHGILDVVDRQAFPIFSSCRQFKRYAEIWPREQWKDLAAAAIAVLGDVPSWTGRVYLARA